LLRKRRKGKLVCEPFPSKKQAAIHAIEGCSMAGEKDRNKPKKQMRIKEVLLPALGILAKRWAMTPPQVVNLLVRLGLETEGLWKPEDK
jgi:hypothetical protein